MATAAKSDNLGLNPNDPSYFCFVFVRGDSEDDRIRHSVKKKQGALISDQEVSVHFISKYVLKS